MDELIQLRAGGGSKTYDIKVCDLFSGGWYQEHSEGKELDWLRKC